MARQRKDATAEEEKKETPAQIEKRALKLKAVACMKCPLRSGLQGGITADSPSRVGLAVEHVKVLVDCPACNSKTRPPTTNGVIEQDPKRCHRYIRHLKKQE